MFQKKITSPENTTPAQERSQQASGYNGPTEDGTRALAYEIFQTRLSTGTAGDALSDWLEAERQLRTEPSRGPAPSGMAS